MRNEESKMSRLFLLSLFTFHFSLFTCFADVPVSINYTGHLDGGEGVALTERNMLMVFRLYAEPGTGRASEKVTALWGRQASVALENGDFDLDLSDSFGAQIANTAYPTLAAAIAAAVKDGSSDMYLGITPVNDANAEIYPRQKLTAVPKAVQALMVRSVPSDFTATGGTFTVAGAMRVTDRAQFEGSTSYGNVAYGPGAALSFKGGVAVEGTLGAGRVDATTVKAESVSAATLVTTDAGSVSVTGRLEAAGSPIWDGALTAQNAAAGKVDGTVTAETVYARTLAANNFINRNALQLLDTKDNVSWHPIGDMESVEAPAYKAEEPQFVAWDSVNRMTVQLTAISTAWWEAPCDCVAYFQTYLYNMSSDRGSCIQFYIVVDPAQSRFTDQTPVGIASFDAAGKYQLPVPILLKKGQKVKWLAYNHNINEQTGKQELSHTKVTKINYQKFCW